MSLHFRYQLDAVHHPVVALGGRWVRPRPIVLATLIGPSGTKAFNGTLDTSGDDTLFPEHWAAPLGIDLSQAPHRYRVGRR